MRDGTAREWGTQDDFSESRFAGRLRWHILAQQVNPTFEDNVYV
jgi:hypothetical protein